MTRPTDRRLLVEGWLWWATFGLAVRQLGHGVVTATTLAGIAVRDLWSVGVR